MFIGAEGKTGRRICRMENDEIIGLGNILIYQTEKGNTRIDVFFQNEDIWMNQSAIAKLYNTTPQNITMHNRNIYADGELDEYSRKGFAMDDERLKNPKQFGEDYFDELLERIREIRASEKRFYQKICDIYKTSIDYSSNDKEAKLFFKTVQNKIHYGVHGHTAAEDQARRHIPMYMKDWETYLNNFLNMTGREVLSGAGHISASQAKTHAYEQYELYNENRRKIEANEVELLIEKTEQIKKEK